MINKEKRIANKIADMLNKRGFVVDQHKSRSSKSIYLKIDKGAIPTIRISDHKRFNSDNCKYNVIRKYNGVRNEVINGRTKKYYNFNNIGRLITDIQLERSEKIISIGYIRYKNMLEGKESRKDIKSNYWRQKVA